jgi:uncharacterized protein (TIGR02186 family)
MRRRFLTYAGLVVLALGIAPAARAQFVTESPLTISLAADHVDITLGFNGANLALFGERNMDGDVAVVIRGPEVPAVVRRKAQVMGLWMNTQSVTFRNVPAYYDLALSRNEAEINAPVALHDNRIGLDTLDFRPDTRVEKTMVEAFQEALIRNRQVQGYFPLEPKRVTFLSNDLFRADFHVPPNVPTGDCIVQTYLLADGEVRDMRETRLRVAQVGFNARLYSFAVQHSLSYGLAAVLIAVVAGWAGFALLRKD